VWKSGAQKNAQKKKEKEKRVNTLRLDVELLLPGSQRSRVMQTEEEKNRAEIKTWEKSCQGKKKQRNATF